MSLKRVKSLGITVALAGSSFFASDALLNLSPAEAEVGCSVAAVSTYLPVLNPNHYPSLYCWILNNGNSARGAIDCRWLPDPKTWWRSSPGGAFGPPTCPWTNVRSAFLEAR
jgi:hypothetical protein